MDIHVHLHFSPAIESLATVLSDQLQKELEKGSASLEPAPRTKKTTAPVPPPSEQTVTTTTSLPVPDGVVNAASTPAPAPSTPSGHTRDSIKAAIKAAGWDKAKTVAMLTKFGAENLAKMAEDKLQEFGNAVLAETAAPSAAPAATPTPAPTAAPAPPAAKGGHTRESVMPLYVDAMAKDRPGLIKLLGDFGVAKLAVLDDAKIPEFGLALEKFLTAGAA